MLLPLIDATALVCVGASALSLSVYLTSVLRENVNTGEKADKECLSNVRKIILT